jgi:hypothetical protein
MEDDSKGRIFKIAACATIFGVLLAAMIFITGKDDLYNLLKKTEQPSVSNYNQSDLSNENLQSTETVQTLNEAQGYAAEESHENATVELVDQVYTGANVTEPYTFTLENYEIIVGQSFGFSYNGDSKTGGGCAFIISGPGTYSFEVTDGEWTKYSNVLTEEDAQLLLQKKIDESVSEIV